MQGNWKKKLKFLMVTTQELGREEGKQILGCGWCKFREVRKTQRFILPHIP